MRIATWNVNSLKARLDKVTWWLERARPDVGRAADRGAAGKAGMTFPLEPPIEPMLSKLATGLPEGEGWLFEPKWDGFRAIVFRDRDRFFLQSRDLRPLDRYFPELKEGLTASLPARCVVDGEIVIATEHGLDFDLLQLRLHPAASRVAKLAAATPSSFVAFDLLADERDDLRSRPQSERRARLEEAELHPAGLGIRPSGRCCPRRAMSSQHLGHTPTDCIGKPAQSHHCVKQRQRPLFRASILLLYHTRGRD